jgi:hypothetical protein
VNLYVYSVAKKNFCHLTIIATWTEVKTRKKQQNYHTESNPQTSLGLWSTALGYGFRFKHRNTRMLPI